MSNNEKEPSILGGDILELKIGDLKAKCEYISLVYKQKGGEVVCYQNGPPQDLCGPMYIALQATTNKVKVEYMENEIIKNFEDKMRNTIKKLLHSSDYLDKSIEEMVNKHREQQMKGGTE